MARIYYYVVNAGTQWEVKYDGQPRGTRYLYATQQEALNIAAGTAKSNWETNSQPSGVRVQAQGGQWREERTYGNDPFPPRG